MIFLCADGFAQERKIIGRIVDNETQKGMADVHIIIWGTSRGATTNALGYFELAVDPIKDYILNISHVGYGTSRIEIPKEDRFKFSLKKEQAYLGRIELTNYPKKIKESKSKGQSENADSESRKMSGSGVEEPKVVESNVEFPGSVEQFLDELGNSIATNAGLITKDVLLTFTVSDSGKVSSFILHDSIPTMEASIRTYFEAMKPCTPASQRGKNVPQQFSVSIGSMSTIKSFYKFMGQKIQYPAQARRLGIEGTVLVEFEISPDGQMSLPIVMRDIHRDCGLEVITALKAVPPDIIAGMAATSTPRKFALPVNFGLEGPHEVPKFNFGPDMVLLHIIEVIAYGTGPRR